MCPAKRHLLHAGLLRWRVCHAERHLLPLYLLVFQLVIVDICLHLQALSRARGVQSSRLLLRELKGRFRKYTDPGDTDHQTIFLVATSLDTRHRLLLSGSVPNKSS